MNHPRPTVTYLCSQPAWNLPKKNGQTFCKSCKKNIPDLRDADQETIKSLLERDGGTTCGIFDPGQFTVNAHTKRSPNVFRLVLAGALATFVSGAKLSAQATVDSVKTEQLDQDGYPVTTPEIVQPAVDTAKAEAPAPAQVTRKRKGRIHLFWLGRREVYLSKRFPYVHSRRMGLMGKFTIILPGHVQPASPSSTPTGN
jgi:hypothetical protein